MALWEQGYDMVKFFPAEAAGGAPALAAIGAPIPQVAFCPTGGITADTAARYLSLPNVMCVGGSWVAPKDKIAARDWSAITELARSAAALAR
jgi:2-dehydro-3-deoxyphosphogluconate aldolase/(4S)-4-hydroxy-2-oxoglutarate aldolase